MIIILCTTHSVTGNKIIINIWNIFKIICISSFIFLYTLMQRYMNTDCKSFELKNVKFYFAMKSEGRFQYEIETLLTDSKMNLSMSCFWLCQPNFNISIFFFLFQTSFLYSKKLMKLKKVQPWILHSFIPTFSPSFFLFLNSFYYVFINFRLTRIKCILCFCDHNSIFHLFFPFLQLR